MSHTERSGQGACRQSRAAYSLPVTGLTAPSTRSRRSGAALAVACVSLVLSLVACGVGAFVVSSSGFDLLPVQSAPETASAAQVEAVAHVTLPPGTVLLSAAYSNGLETHLSAKFRIPRTELDAFISAGKFTAPLTTGLRAVTASHNLGGDKLWDPESASAVSGIEEQQPTADGTFRAILVNFDAPNAVTVYLYASRP